MRNLHDDENEDYCEKENQVSALFELSKEFGI
jgi:hypothetical protein